jgi:hypothetical protein
MHASCPQRNEAGARIDPRPGLGDGEMGFGAG